MGRAEWDRYFMTICEAVSSKVACKSRALGSVITRHNRIISTGYNGPPSGFPHPSTCKRRELGIPSGSRLSLCPCAHAERNAIDTAARMGHSTAGTTLYLNSGIPCLDCAYSIVAAGISEVVALNLNIYPQEGYTGYDILAQCNVWIRVAGDANEFC